MPKRDALLVAFGRNVRKRREAKDLTQETLAEAAGLDRSYISDVERGGRNLSLHSMHRIASALATTVSEITKGIQA
jgi:transcriptional regulator with XRE-family HTH domain